MKLTAAILLVIITGSSLFYYGYFDAMIVHSKHKAAQSVITAENNHTLKLFKVSAKQQDKYSDDEIWVNGDLYDVAERKIIQDTLYVSLYHDADEESILSVITDFFKTDDNTYVSAFPNAPVLKSVKVIYNPLYTVDSFDFLLQVNAISYVRFIKNSGNTSLPFYEIITPPPRLS
jgi:hypothetical protein